MICLLQAVLKHDIILYLYFNYITFRSCVFLTSQLKLLKSNQTDSSYGIRTETKLWTSFHFNIIYNYLVTLSFIKLLTLRFLEKACTVISNFKMFSLFYIYTGYTQKNGAVSKVNKKFISHLKRAKRTPSAAATVQVSHALRAVRISCLLRGRGASFQDGVAAGKGFLCAPFWGVQMCDYSAAWVSCTV